MDFEDDDLPRHFLGNSWWQEVVANHAVYKLNKKTEDICWGCGLLFDKNPKGKFQIFCSYNCGLRYRRRLNPEQHLVYLKRYRAKPHARRLAVIRQTRYRLKKKLAEMHNGGADAHRPGAE